MSTESPDLSPEGLLPLRQQSPGLRRLGGQTFDLSVLPADQKHSSDRAFIAGGINEENVEDVLRLKPFGVDLVSSLKVYPGKKKTQCKMERFVKRVRSFAI